LFSLAEWPANSIELLASRLRTPLAASSSIGSIDTTWDLHSFFCRFYLTMALDIDRLYGGKGLVWLGE
jgi:hypothetical protein